MIKLPISVGDTILIGKWRNKKLKITSIKYDPSGLPIINGDRKICNFRIPKDKEEEKEIKENMKFKDIIKESKIK